jgi:hypothetical protein
VSTKESKVDAIYKEMGLSWPERIVLRAAVGRIGRAHRRLVRASSAFARMSAEAADKLFHLGNMAYDDGDRAKASNYCALSSSMSKAAKTTIDEQIGYLQRNSTRFGDMSYLSGMASRVMGREDEEE